MTTNLDAIVIGGGLAGLAAGLRLRRQRPDARIAVLEARPEPGGEVRTVRSNGFVCELGPFAFARDEVQPVLDLLARPPRVVAAADDLEGAWFDGEQLHHIAVEPAPVSFATGCEELVQACRRELGDSLRLGRAVTKVLPIDADGGVGGVGFDVTLGGEVPTTVRANELVVAVDTADAAQLLFAFDPMLPEVGQHIGREARAMVFLGGLAAEAPELRGYGVLAGDDVPGPAREAIFCNEVFPNRALRDRCLARVELHCDREPDDATCEALAEQALRRWTGTAAAFGFRKVHRFTTPQRGGAYAECRARIAELTRRVPGLSTT
ncbi:MAG: NAD(P)-binding protein [Planctomycetota bacterium]